jgi:hypothetical protein
MFEKVFPKSDGEAVQGRETRAKKAPDRRCPEQSKVK